MTEKSKHEYLQDLQEVVDDPMFIGSSQEDLMREIETNMWRLSCSRAIAEQLTVEDLEAFFDDVVESRRAQLRASELEHGMLFYVWFDEQAGQLRFNLISDVHSELPFRCQTRRVSELGKVISQFLESRWLDGIPFEELERIEGFPDVEGLVESNVSETILDVFVTNLP